MINPHEKTVKQLSNFELVNECKWSVETIHPDLKDYFHEMIERFKLVSIQFNDEGFCNLKR